MKNLGNLHFIELPAFHGQLFLLKNILQLTKFIFIIFCPNTQRNIKCNMTECLPCLFLFPIMPVIILMEEV